jgi:uncharacterized protein
MRIAICADIHDNIWVLERALVEMGQAGAVLFCGDLCAPFTLVQLAEGVSVPVHVVWGNNDGDKWLLTQQAARFDHVSLHGELAEVELGGLRIGMNHYPGIAGRLARSGDYDLVCYGHDHQSHKGEVGATVLLNPGELMGRFGASTYALFDTDTRQVEICTVQR